MINTILNGLVSISINVLDWFLTPIWNLIDNINIGNNTISDMVSSFNNLLTMITDALTWVIDATGIPPSLFLVIFSIYLTSIILRFSIYIVKAVLRWWDKIVA